MRAIVTGSSGFIGSALSQKLLDQGWDVFGIDSHSDYYAISLKELRLASLVKNRKFKFVPLDLSLSNDFAKILSEVNPQAVFHLAAQAGVRIPTEQLEKYVSSNLVAFSNVLQACITQEIPNFLFASSSSVYGDQASLPYSEKEINLRPNSFYGGTKLANEILAGTLAPTSKTRIRGMRFFTVYGPMGRPDMAYFRIISSLLAGTKFELFGNGTVERDFTYINDCVSMITLLEAELRSHPNGFSDIVNIGGGHPTSMNTLISIVQNQFGSEMKYKIGLPNQKDVLRTMADSSYLVSLVGDKPSTSLEVGIGLTIDWAKDSSINQELRSWVDSSI